MNWDKGLQGAVHTIAGSQERRLRVMAGPGTGKSFALQRRVARLLEEGQDPTRVMVVTFTRNAAASLVQDLHSLNVHGCDEIHVGTLHSFCFSLLNRADVFAYLKRVPRPLIAVSKSGSLQFEGGVLLDDLISQRFGTKRDCTKRIRAFEAAWARLQHEAPGWAQSQLDQDFQHALISWLRFHQAILIGELVPEALRFLRNNPLSDVRRAFDHVIVDEYQDLNRAEQEIVDLVADKCSSAIVGDADQSIYSFRYANPEGIDDFLNRHPTTHDETLIECRRCPTRVVTIANHLIRNNHPGYSPPRLKAYPSNLPGEIHIVQWKEPNEEASGLTDFVKHLVATGYGPNDILVLTPRRRLAYPIRDVLSGQGLPVHSFYHEEAIEEKYSQRVLTLLALLSNKDDRVALRWWLGCESQTGLRASYRILRQHCEATGHSPRDVLEAVDNQKLKLNGVSHLLSRYRELNVAIESLSDLQLPDLIDSLLPEKDEQGAALREVALHALSHCRNICELFDNIRTHITQPEIPKGDFIRIMSPQKAKGLTSRAVVVTGCVEGVFPVIDDDMSPQEAEDNIQEQRRLFYVAITRCTDILLLSSVGGIEGKLAKNIGARLSSRGRHFGWTISSRFISELGPMAPRPRVGSEWQASGYRTR